MEFSPNVNCFVGANGMGKSNILDAIYYLSFCRGYSCAKDACNIMHGEDYFIIEADYEFENGTYSHVCCSLKNGSRKRLKANGKDVRKISDHIGSIPLVMIAPSDSALITGGSEERRKFMDTVIMQYNSAYVESIIRYDRSLKQRNALLKQEQEPNPDVLDVVEELMAADSEVIYNERMKFTQELLPIFRELYDKLGGKEGEHVELIYRSHCERGSLRGQLREGRVKERIVGYTLHGTHKDDLELDLNGFEIKREGSQGQQKTFYIALKLAQFLLLRDRGNHRTPLLLLDDIFDKLDASRVQRIIQYVSQGDFGQIFITDTRREHLDHILAETKKDYRLYEVIDGQVAECSQQ